MAYGTIFIFLISIALLLLISYYAIRPEPLKPLIRLAIRAPVYELDAGVTVSSGDDYVLYGRADNQSVAVFIIGGAFLFNDFSSHYGFANYLSRRLEASGVNLLMIRYPVRFKNTIYDAMMKINELLKTHALRYKSCQMIGFSAGSLLAGTFVRKEKSKALADLLKVPRIGLTVRSIVGICGLYDVVFDNEILTSLFDFYIMSGTPQSKRYNCQNLGIPSFVVSSKYDMLVKQTTRYAQTEPCSTKIYAERLPHAFVQCINLPQAQDAAKLIGEFITKNK